ncbi:hypothetical protein [Paenibacillus crassostreae]|nr:hypothetical protein [Paenibacillus crassostreae]
MVNFVLTDFSSGRIRNESLVLGGGAVANTIFDLYSTLDNHEQFLDVIEHRFPNEMGDATPLEWINKVETLYQDGDNSVSGYVSAYAGQQAENITVDHLTSSGEQASQFESRIHENDDVRAIDENGIITDYSVKSYGSIDSFNQAVTDHPESSHYFVNHELYAQLEEKGLLSSYLNKGIDIEDGGYLNETLRSEASSALDAIHGASDVADHIPFLGLAMLGIKSVRNTHEYYKGKQSGNEFGINVVSDTVRIGASTGGAVVGAKAGAIIGTAIAPGIGTIVAGGIGGIVCSMATGSMVNWFKEKWKWGDILKAQYNIGSQFINGFSQHMKSTIKHRTLPYKEVQSKLEIAQSIKDKYRKQLKPYSFKKVSHSAVLAYLHESNLSAFLKRINNAAEITERQLLDLCGQAAARQVANDSHKKKKEVASRFLGELVLTSSYLKSDFDMKRKFGNEIHMYEKQKSKNPNHPFQFSQPSDSIIEGIAIRSLFNSPLIDVKSTYYKKKNKALLGICIITLLIAIASLYLYNISS